MSNPNPGTIYVLTNGSNSSSVGTALNGCKIKETTNDYEFYTQNGSTYVQKLAGPLPVTFEDVSITQGNVTTTWDITVIALPSTTDAGSWVTPSAFRMNPDDTNPSGEFTAMAGGAVDPEETAASAGHGRN